MTTPTRSLTASLTWRDGTTRRTVTLPVLSEEDAPEVATLRRRTDDPARSRALRTSPDGVLLERPTAYRATITGHRLEIVNTGVFCEEEALDFLEALETGPAIINGALWEPVRFSVVRLYPTGTALLDHPGRRGFAPGQREYPLQNASTVADIAARVYEQASPTDTAAPSLERALRDLPEVTVTRSDLLPAAMDLDVDAEVHAILAERRLAEALREASDAYPGEYVAAVRAALAAYDAEAWAA